MIMMTVEALKLLGSLDNSRGRGLVQIPPVPLVKPPGYSQIRGFPRMSSEFPPDTLPSRQEAVWRFLQNAAEPALVSPDADLTDVATYH